MHRTDATAIPVSATEAFALPVRPGESVTRIKPSCLVASPRRCLAAVGARC